MEPTCDTAEVAKSMGASERWVIERIRAGQFPARKIMRSWRMTDSDVAAALDSCLKGSRVAEVVDMATGLTPHSRRRVVGQ